MINEIFLDFVCQVWKHNSISSLTSVARSSHLNAAVIKLLEGDQKTPKRQKEKKDPTLGGIKGKAGKKSLNTTDEGHIPTCERMEQCEAFECLETL